MSNNPDSDSSPNAAATDGLRRALVIADSSGTSLRQQLAAAGYLTRSATTPYAPAAIGEFGPDLVIMVVSRASGEVENESVALARKLRSETATYSLPVVFVWDEDDHSLRAAAQYTGVDDYFPLSTPHAEILARLDSLFWRAEAGRRSAPVAGDRRLEIDNFMFMLDAVREDVRTGVTGTLALIYAVGVSADDETFDKAARDRTLQEVHGFLKLNLRRIDAAAFYGPTALMVYLPRVESGPGAGALARLHREFLEEHPGHEFVAGLASFPEHGRDVEGLIEKAEAAANDARKGERAGSILVFEPGAEMPAPLAAAARPEPEPDLPEETIAPASPAATFTKMGEALIHEPAREEVKAETKEETIEEAKEPAKEEEKERSPASTSEVFAGTGEVGSNGDDEAIVAGAAARGAEEAAAREMERRASGAIMPRRLLLTISNSARMTQINSLIRSAGYEARAAFDGQQALHLLRIERPDLLLLDYELQGIDGVETIRRLRKQGGGRLSLPVVMLLSSDNETARREAIELGARTVLVAPYDPAELLTSVRVAGTPE